MNIADTAVVWLPVSDIDRSITFFTERLGLTENQRDEDWAELQAGHLLLGLNGRNEESPGGQGGAVIAFSPKGELDEAVEELRSAGVEFVGGISEHPWGRVAAFKDPDGNDLQLFAPPQR